MNRNKGARRLGGFIMILAVTILACQSVSNFNPFVTATPTATATFTPSSTPTPTPTFTPTNTPTATFTPAPTLPPNGRMTKELPDGTTLFLDYDGSYQVIFPEGWVVIIMEDDDITRALDSLPDQDKSVSELIDALRKTSGSDLIRAIGVKSRAQQGLYAPNISIAYDKNPFSKAMSLQALIDATVEYYPSLKIRVIHSGIEKTSSGIEIGVIEIQWSAKITSSKTLNLRQKQILFKSGEGTVIITFSTTRDSKVNLDADFKLLIESIKLLD